MKDYKKPHLPEFSTQCTRDGKLVSYKGYTVHYQNRSNIDKTQDNEKVKWYSERKELMDSKGLEEHREWMETGYKPLNVSPTRINKIVKLNENIFNHCGHCCCFKIDITDLSGEIDHVEFNWVMRQFTEERRLDPLLQSRVLGHARCIEKGNNGKVGLHLYVILNIDDYWNSVDRNKCYIRDRNMVVRWIIDILDKNGILFRKSDINVSEMIRNTCVVVSKDDYWTRNSLMCWMSYVCKLNKVTSDWQALDGLRLFSVSSI